MKKILGIIILGSLVMVSCTTSNKTSATNSNTRKSTESTKKDNQSSKNDVVIKGERASNQNAKAISVYDTKSTLKQTKTENVKKVK